MIRICICSILLPFLPAAARWVFATGGGSAPTDFDRRRRRHWKPAVAFGGATGRQLLLMLNINDTNEQEDKPEKFS